LGVPAGTFLLALQWFVRREAHSGADYIRGRFEVVWGPGKGRSFYTNVSFDTTKPGAVTRLAVWCEAVGQQEEFDLSNDREVKRVFLHQPFKARVSAKKGRKEGEVDNDIERYETTLTPDEQAAVDAILDELEQKGALEGGGADDDFNDDPVRGGGGDLGDPVGGDPVGGADNGAGGDPSPPDDDWQPPDDGDEIPF
jgi:hypothetical protein